MKLLREFYDTFLKHPGERIEFTFTVILFIILLLTLWKWGEAMLK
jgi:hypothetical protein